MNIAACFQKPLMAAFENYEGMMVLHPEKVMRSRYF
jgi:hypothetical protein